MAEIPRAYVDNFTRALNGVSAANRAALGEALGAIDYTQDVADVREQAIAIMQTWCGGSTDEAAILAAEFYDGLREYEIGSRMGAVANSERDPYATDGAVRAFAEKLVDGKPEEFIRLCLERLDYEVKVAASQTALNNAKLDPRKPRFARVPTGAETCDFCLMLASRGFVYHTEAAASHAHAGCDCRVVPSWRAHEVEGYDPSAIYDQWKDSINAKAAERAERNGTSESDEYERIMGGYARSAAKANERRTPSRGRAYRPEKAKNFVPDDKAKKQAQILLRGMSKEKERDRAIESIVKAQEQWDKSVHSVDMDNYFAKRIGRLMVEHAIRPQELASYANARLANAIT